MSFREMIGLLQEAKAKPPSPFSSAMRSGAMTSEMLTPDIIAATILATKKAIAASQDSDPITREAWEDTLTLLQLAAQGEDTALRALVGLVNSSPGLVTVPTKNVGKVKIGNNFIRWVADKFRKK